VSHSHETGETSPCLCEVKMLLLFIWQEPIFIYYLLYGFTNCDIAVYILHKEVAL